MRRAIPLLLAVAAALSGCATSAPSRTIVIPAGWEEAYDEYHYAPAVRVGDTVIVSGLPAYGEGSYEDKIAAMFRRLEQLLGAAGATLADVVEIQTFHADVRDTASFQEEFAKFLKPHAAAFRDGFPAWTAVGTTALLARGAPVEMRVVAVVGSGTRTRVERAKAAE